MILNYSFLRTCAAVKTFKLKCRNLFYKLFFNKFNILPIYYLSEFHRQQSDHVSPNISCLFVFLIKKLKKIK